MKKVLALVAVVGLVSTAVPARAHHLPNAWCSESGDVCLSTKMSDGKRKLRIGLGARYFNRYELCVNGPESTTCHTYEITNNDGVYGDSVRWDRNFPNEGSGRYTVTWKFMNGDRIGRRLGFHN